LGDKITNDPAIVELHAGAVSVEDAGDASVHSMLPAVISKQRFCAPFTFVVTSSRSGEVNMADIVLLLRVNSRFAIDLTRRRLNNAGSELFGQGKQVDRAEYTGFRRSDGVLLVVLRRSRASEVVYFINLNCQWVDNVVMQKFEFGMLKEAFDISAASGLKVVDTYYVPAFGNQALAKVGAYEAGAATY
jgi:hypothetical protein